MAKTKPKTKMYPGTRARPSGRRIVPRKQSATHEQFQEAWRNIHMLVTKDEIDSLIERTVHDIKLVTNGRKVAYAWSGGKDSQALEFVCRLAGIEPCVMVISDLEWPEFFRWVTNHMPPGLEVIHQKGVNLDWLSKNQHMLFPNESKLDAKWFKMIQWSGQTEYYNRENLDMILLGRRSADGNNMGRTGEQIYTNKAGITRYAPCFWWRHVDVFALCHYYKMDIAPIYDWPRGFRVGTHAWAARQWTGNHENAWKECWLIDPDVVRVAATKIKSAKDWMARHGLK